MGETPGAFGAPGETRKELAPTGVRFGKALQMPTNTMRTGQLQLFHNQVFRGHRNFTPIILPNTSSYKVGQSPVNF